MNSNGKVKIRNLILSIILIFLCMVIYYNKSHANESQPTTYGNGSDYSSNNYYDFINNGKKGDTVFLGVDNSKAIGALGSNNELYCVQHSRSHITGNYEVNHVIEIKGMEATSLDKDNKPIETTENASNALLAYILCGGNYEKGAGDITNPNNRTGRQRTLWKNWDNWMTNSGNKLVGEVWKDSQNGNTTEDTNLKTAAEDYAKNDRIPSVQSNVGETISSNSEEWVGPFNITYSGIITSIDVIDIDGNSINENFQFKYDKNNNYIDQQEIKSGKNFYIDNWSGKKIKEIKINVKSFNARILFLSCPNKQNLIAVKELPSTNAQITIRISSSVLRVVKSAETIDGHRQAGVGFIIYDATENKYLKRKGSTGTVVVNDGQINFMDLDYTASNRDLDRNSATIFETQTQLINGSTWAGYFQINNIPAHTYFIGEVYNKNTGYGNSNINDCVFEVYNGDQKMYSFNHTDIAAGNNISYNISNKLPRLWVVRNINVQSGYTNILRISDSHRARFNLVINKVNQSNRNTKIGGAEFRIKVNDRTVTDKWLLVTKDENNQTTYDLTNDYRYSTVFNTATSRSVASGRTVYSEEEGVIYLSDLPQDYGYSICEFNPGTGYGSIISQASNGVNVTINNSSRQVKNYVSIDNSTRYINCGTVEFNEDRPTTEVEITNRQIGSGSHTTYPTLNISGRIWLDKDLSGTQKKGTYNYLYDNGETYSGSVTVSLWKKGDDVNTEDQRINSTSASAGSYNLSTPIIIDSNVSNMSDTLSEYYLKFDYNNNYLLVETKYNHINGSKALKHTGNSACIYNLDEFITNSLFYSNNTLNYMNLGFVEMNVNQGIQATVYDVTTTIKGQEYVYAYGRRTTGGAASVDLGNRDYYCRIHKSDVVYSKQQNVKDGLNVKIRYYIKITNNTGWNSTSTNRYNGLDINNIKFSYGQGDYVLKSSGWRQTTENGRTVLIKNNAASGLGYRKSLDLIVEFELSGSAYNKILDNGGFTETPTISFEGTHKYQKYEFDHYSISYKVSNNRIRKIKTPVYEWHSYTEDVNGSSSVSGMSFALKEIDSGDKSRIIEGSVFEDKKRQDIYNSNGEVIGNGKLDNAETLLKDVKVELLENKKNASGEYIVAKQYVYNKNGMTNQETYQAIDAIDNTTHEDNTYGTYKFENLVPGEYIIRFTYGNGDQKIQYYKSTVITGSKIKDMYTNSNNDKKWTWYTNNSDNYSIATDNLAKRAEFNQAKALSEIPAYSPPLMIGIEEGQTSNNGQVQTTNNNSTYKVSNMNFGIITIPKIILGVDKNIVNVKVTNSQGNIIRDGNPYNANNLMNLDSRKSRLVEGSNFVKIEIDNNELYGAQLEIKYAITIINNSELNYWEQKGSEYYGNYYKFGDSSHSTEVGIQIKEVDDYLLKELNLSGFDHGITNIDTNNKTTDTASRTPRNSTDSFESYKLKVKGNWENIYSKRKSTNSNKSQDTAEIIATKTLSHDSKDSYFVNEAEVSDIKIFEQDFSDNKATLIEDLNKFRIDDQYTNYFTYKDTNNVSFENPTLPACLTIIPSTGENKLEAIWYILSGVVLLIIMSVGIVIIKKKVISK